MSIEAVHRQYNDVVAPHYDLDPQGVIGRSFDRVVEQLQNHHILGGDAQRLRVLDVGMGTGLFLARLKALNGDCVQPFGIDLAEKMVECARQRLPDLTAEVEDAAHLDACFPGLSFDLICTHFITGFVSMDVLAPKIWGRLHEGGAWSLMGGTRAGFPTLRARGTGKSIRWLSGAQPGKFDDGLVNPEDVNDVVRTVQRHGFEVCAAETFEPEVEFAHFEQFMEFGYQGGWFTPIIEAIGLQKAKAPTRWLLNRLVFPFKDHHSIAVVLARKLRT